MTTSQDSWEEEFEHLVTYAQGDENKARLLRLLNNLLFTVQKEAYQRGKDHAVEYVKAHYTPFANRPGDLLTDVLEAAKHPSSRKEEGV